MRIRIALALLALSYVLGWPAVGAAGSASPWIGVEAAAMLGSGTYAFSWLLLGGAVVLGGKEVQEEGRRWTARVMARLRPSIAASPAEGGPASQPDGEGARD
jgi:hypothetical protein